MKFLVANGPNLNLLGSRRPDIYGSSTLDELDAHCREWGSDVGVLIETFQTNHEGRLLDRLHSAVGAVDGVVINAGAWTHSSYALRDAVEATGIPTVEVHLSNVKEREPFRAHSVLEPVSVATIYGRGEQGYRWAIRRLHALITAPPAIHRYGSHSDQVAELRLPAGDGPFPVVVLIHGGFWRHPWRRDTLEPISLDLIDNGIATWNIEYRCTGAGGGGAATMTDVAAAVAALAGTDAPLDLTKVAFLGHSAGGQLALWASSASGASLRPVVAVSLAGVTDLTRARSEQLGSSAVEAFLGSADPTPYSPIDLLPLGTPSLCVHGTADAAVPAHFSESFVQAASEAGDTSELLCMDGVDHFEPIEPTSPSWHLTRDRLLSILAP